MRKKIYDAIDRERGYQDSKWRDGGHSQSEWILVLESRIAKAKQVWVDSGSYEKIQGEILIAAACAVAAIEEHGICERKRLE